MSERQEQLLTIARKITEILQLELSKLPFGANVIDELHADENAHSRILRMLLQYKSYGKYPIYSRFLSLIHKYCNVSPANDQSTEPVFRNEVGDVEDGRVDLLITDKTPKDKFAIILENKVCGAGDQDKQLERYVNFVNKAEGVKDENIFVIYLTKDGLKEVSESSLTPTVKKRLNISDEIGNEGRFIKLDYKHHIISWLEELIPEMPLKEELLTSSLRLYLDYLKGICGVRESEEPVYKKTRDKMEDLLGLKSTQDYLQAVKDISLLKEQLEKVLIERKEQVLEEYFYKPLEPFLNDLFPGAFIKEKDFQEHSKYDCAFYCRIHIPSWKRTELIINPESNLCFGIVHISEDNQLSSEEKKTLRDNLSYKGKSSIWWPWWMYLSWAVPSAESFDFISDIENGTLFNVYSKWLTEVASLTQNMEM